MRSAIVVGSEGQDGRLLFDKLDRDGRHVIGIGRNSVRESSGARRSAVDITDRDSVADLLERNSCDVFFLAAVHQSAESTSPLDDAELIDRSWQVHVKALVNFLEAMSRISDGALFYAASSHVFGDPETEPQSETTPFRPTSLYAITKAAGVHVCRHYRTARGVRASSGIRFNHESPLRGSSFLSKKITTAAAAIAKAGQGELVVGSLQARADWGYAPDFVEAMIKIIAHPVANDFVVATGESHTVQEFVTIAFEHVGLDWKNHVVEDARILTRPSASRVGDPTRLMQATGWRPTIRFEEMVRLLVDAAVESA